MPMQITLKSGTQIEVDVENFTVRRGTVSGQLAELEWVTPPGFTAKLSYVDLSEVAAIVCLEPAAPEASDD